MRGGTLPLLPRRGRLALAAAVALAVLVGSVVPLPPGPPQPAPLLDEGLHVAAYALLALSLAYATGSTTGTRPASQVAVVFLVAAAYGVGVEGLQALVPTRGPGALDALANAAGALAVVPWAVVEARLGYVPVGETG